MALAFAGAACLFAFSWMYLVARFDYAGNWTAFYRTGARTHLPPLAARENLYILKGESSGGYDGQFYRLIAQDPFLLHGTAEWIDGPRLRYRRILMPLMAWLAAAGQPLTATYTYIGVVILFLGLGVYWSCRLADSAGRPTWWGLAFVLAPAAFLSIDRLTVDIGLAALTVAFIFYLRTGCFWKLYLTLAFAPLAKETGLLLLGGFILWAVFEGHGRKAALMATAGIPAAAWFAYVQTHTLPDGTAWIQAPLSAVIHGMLHPELYPLRRWFITPFDYLAWLGMILAIALSLARWRRSNAFAYPALLFAVLASVIDFNVWQEVEGYGRVFTPLLILLPFVFPEWRALLPVAMMLPRALVFPAAETLKIFLH
jgi:hypothetical protein